MKMAELSLPAPTEPADRLNQLTLGTAALPLHRLARWTQADVARMGPRANFQANENPRDLNGSKESAGVFSGGDGGI